jgi:hypothetical protein
MPAHFRAGDPVIYDGPIPCCTGDTGHEGIVTAVAGDASGDQVVTVDFDCDTKATQDIMASDLRLCPECD